MYNGASALAGRGRGLGDQAKSVASDLFKEFNKNRPGRANIVVNHETILADSQGQIILPIKTSAPFFLEYFAVSIDDIPMYALATVPIDVEGLTWQNETDQTEVNVINGSGNIMTIFGVNGTLNVNYLSRAALIHQGSEIVATFTNRDAQNDHRIDIAAHGFLTSREEMEFYIKG